jgi:hypothetical protein
MNPLGPFRGLDKRVGVADLPGYLSEALNVILDTDGSLIRRPATSYRAALPADSVGLYAVGEQLRVCAPYNGGDLTSDDALAPTLYVDYVTSPSPRTLDALLGQVTDSDARSLVLLRYDDNSSFLHHCPTVGTAPATQTKLGGLGFTPNFSLVRASGRAWTLSADLRKLQYSAVDSLDPTRLEDWGQTIDGETSIADPDGAGFEVVSQHTAGAGNPQALGMFGRRLVVFYRAALLIYSIDVDQGKFFLEQTIQGPGTTSPHSVASFDTDTLFLSEAGVRSLQTVTQTLDARSDAMGGRIDPLALELAEPSNITPVGHYARRLGCYLLAFGQDVLCLAMLPGQGVLGWTQWRLPMAVDAWAEAGGLVWFRSGNSLFALEDGLDNDQTGASTTANIPILVETVPLRSTDPTVATAVAVSSNEPVRVQVVADGRPGVDIGGVPMGQPLTLPPRAPEPARAIVSKTGRTFAVRVYDAAANSGWRMSNVWLEVARAGA